MSACQWPMATFTNTSQERPQNVSQRDKQKQQRFWNELMAPEAM